MQLVQAPIKQRQVCPSHAVVEVRSPNTLLRANVPQLKILFVAAHNRRHQVQQVLHTTDPSTHTRMCRSKAVRHSYAGFPNKQSSTSHMVPVGSHAHAGRRFLLQRLSAVLMRRRVLALL